MSVCWACRMPQIRHHALPTTFPRGLSVFWACPMPQIRHYALPTTFPRALSVFWVRPMPQIRRHAQATTFPRALSVFWARQMPHMRHHALPITFPRPLSVCWTRQMTQIRYYPHTTSPALCQPARFTWLWKKKFAYQLHRLMVSLTVIVIMPLRRCWPDTPSPMFSLAYNHMGEYTYHLR